MNKLFIYEMMMIPASY